MSESMAGPYHSIWLDCPGPYHNIWLDSGYFETLLPNSPWHKIKGSINKLLVQEVKKLHPQTDLTSSVLRLLGPKFLEEYLQNESGIAFESLNKSNEQDLKEQAESWLNDKLEKIIRQLKLNSVENADVEDEGLSRDFLEFMGFGQQVVYRGMERELSLVETRQNDMNGQCFANGSLISGPQSEALGVAVSCLLRKTPSCLKRMSHQLMGRQLPNTLRQLIWEIKIFKAESLTNIDSHTNDLRKQFMATLRWGEKELGIEKPICSPVDGIIRHAVNEIYSLVPCIQDGNMRRVCVTMATEALNILYVHSRYYEPQYALLVLPLVWTYLGYALKPDFTSQNLAELMYYLLKNCFPTRLEVFAIADHVITRLQKDDPQLLDHMISSMQRNIAFDPREFLVNFMHKERKRALEMEKSLAKCQVHFSQDENVAAEARSFLSHPIIFIRKWIGEGFVGILDLPAILFIWDQCFLDNWQAATLENVCLVLLQLLRTKLLLAQDYHGIKMVLLNHPHRLYTHDIQRGVVYLSNGGTLQDVGSLREPSWSETDLNSLQSSSISDQTSRVDSIRSSNQTGSSTMAPEQPDLGELWVEKRLFDSPASERISNFGSFDLYIDEVRFIPDNATIIKVTGRILSPFWEKPASLDISDVETYAMLDSPARCPQFHFQYPVFPPRGGVPGDSILLLRVYTLDVDMAELVVIGNCAVNLYQQEGDKYYLNKGAKQLRLKHQLPSSVTKLSEDIFTDQTDVPVVTLLIRILPHSQDFIEPPGYSSGDYESSAFITSESEKRIYTHYKMFEPYPPTVREAIRDVREEEQNTEEVISDQEMEKWYKNRMRKEQLDKKPAKSLELANLVQYDQKQGLSFSVEQAFGLPNPCFVNVLAYVSEGPTACMKGKTGFAGEESSLISDRDFGSLQKSPKWVDDPKKIHPHLDPLSSLVLQVYSLDGLYEPRVDRQGPGSVLEKKGKRLTLESQGWTVLQLFNKKYVNGGLHHLPLFEGTPSTSFKEFLSAHHCDISLCEAVRQDIHQLQGASSIKVSVWDGHYTQDGHISLPVKEDLLSIGNKTKIIKASQVRSGKAISDLVLQSLTRQERKGGVSGQPFNREKDYYQEAMNMVFASLLENVLLELGLGPM